MSGASRRIALWIASPPICSTRTPFSSTISIAFGTASPLRRRFMGSDSNENRQRGLRAADSGRALLFNRDGDRLALFDDVGREHDGLSLRDVLGGVDRVGRNENRLAGFHDPRRLTGDFEDQLPFEHDPHFLARVSVLADHPARFELRLGLNPVPAGDAQILVLDRNALEAGRLRVEHARSERGRQTTHQQQFRFFHWTPPLDFGTQLEYYPHLRRPG